MFYTFYYFFSGSVLKDCYKYDEASNEWDQIASMAQEREHYGLVQMTPDSFWISGRRNVVLRCQIRLRFKHT